MDLLNLFGSLVIIYALIKCFNNAIGDEAAIRQLHHDKIEDQERNMYTLSESHQLVMERIRIEDMELQNNFVPMQQQFQLEKWYAKIHYYSCKYFRNLSVIEEGQRLSNNKVVNLAQRAQPTYEQYTEHQPE
jgi:hypothetical protein